MGKKREELYKENELFNSKFGFILSEHRSLKDLTQEELSYLMKLHEDTVGTNERGISNFPFYYAYLYINILDIPQEVIIDFLYNPKYMPQEVKDKMKEMGLIENNDI